MKALGLIVWIFTYERGKFAHVKRALPCDVSSPIIVTKRMKVSTKGPLQEAYSNLSKNTSEIPDFRRKRLNQKKATYLYHFLSLFFLRFSFSLKFPLMPEGLDIKRKRRKIILKIVEMSWKLQLVLFSSCITWDSFSCFENEKKMSQ